jgi:hypothetical protein
MHRGARRRKPKQAASLRRGDNPKTRQLKPATGFRRHLPSERVPLFAA